MNMPKVKLFDQPITEETEWVARVTKVTLLHTNGVSSEMKLYAPIYSAWGEVQELSNNALRDYVNSLTKCFLSLVGYQIHLGSMDVEGNEHYGITYPAFQIPVDKVYYKGKWVKLTKVPQESPKQQEQRIIRVNKMLKKGDNKFDKKHKKSSRQQGNYSAGTELKS